MLSWFRSRQDRVVLFRSAGAVATLQGKQTSYTGVLECWSIGEVINALRSNEFHYSIAPLLHYSNTYVSLIGRS